MPVLFSTHKNSYSEIFVFFCNHKLQRCCILCHQHERIIKVKLLLTSTHISKIKLGPLKKCRAHVSFQCAISNAYFELQFHLILVDSIILLNMYLNIHLITGVLRCYVFFTFLDGVESWTLHSFAFTFEGTEWMLPFNEYQ